LVADVVEVKARSPGGGGCSLAETEAEGYRSSLDAIRADFVAVSQGLARAGGLRVVGKNEPNAHGRRLLDSVDATKTNPRRWSAWTFYNSLQNKLNRTFITAFDGLSAKVNADGDPTQTYRAAGPWHIECKKRGKNTPGAAALVYQVSGKGGVSYGCNHKCSDEEEERRKEVQPYADKRRDKSRGSRLTQEGGDEPEIKDPGRQPDLPGGQPGKVPGKRPGDQPADQPGGQPVPVSDPSEIPAILAAAAALASAAAYAKTKAQKIALEEAYKKAMTSLAEHGAKETAKRLMINGVKLESKVLTEAFKKDAEQVLVRDLENLGERELEKLALRQGEKLALKEGEKLAGAAAKQFARKAAGKALAKAVPFLSVVLIAADALAMADHVSKGGTIEFGLTGSEADLSGSTNVKGTGPKAGAGTETKLTDTKVDIETTGIPNLSGTAEIDFKNVTISGSVKGDGTPVTVAFKMKLENSTIVIRHGGVIRGGKVVLGGDVTAKDAQIEIDLPEGASAVSPGKPVTFPPGKLKITSTGGGGGAGAEKAGAEKAGAGGQAPGQQPPDPKKKEADEALKGLSDKARSRLNAAGQGVHDLVVAMLRPGQDGKGVKADDAAVDAILKVLHDNKVKAEELPELKKHIGDRATSLDELVKRLDTGIKAVRAANKGATPPGDPDEPSPDKPTSGTMPASPAPTTGKPPPPPKPVDPKAKKFKGMKPTEVRLPMEDQPEAGTVIKDIELWGLLPDGRPFEATVTVQVLEGGLFKITSSSQLRTQQGYEKGYESPWFVGPPLHWISHPHKPGAPGSHGPRQRQTGHHRN
jgi:hypothetical protein